MKTREEHLAWAKQRALEYLDRGEPVRDAIASVLSDLGKHKDTIAEGRAMSAMGLAVAMNQDRREARRFIEGFR